MKATVAKVTASLFFKIEERKKDMPMIAQKKAMAVIAKAIKPELLISTL